MTDREISLSKCKNIEFDFEQVTWNLDLLVHRNRVCNVLKCPGRCPTCLSVSKSELDSRYGPKSPGRTVWTRASLAREVSRVSSGCPRGVSGRAAARDGEAGRRPDGGRPRARDEHAQRPGGRDGRRDTSLQTGRSGTKRDGALAGAGETRQG
jgi:hypothetical protein